MKITSQMSYTQCEYVPDKEDMIAGVAYLSRKYDTVAYLCPCGCGDETHLRIRGEDNLHPSWEVTITPEDKITVHPSILRRGGCLSHYFIKEGEVSWC